MRPDATVELDASDIRLAHEWSDAVEAAVIGRNPTGFAVEDRYVHGYLGELAMFRRCEALGLRCRYTVATTGRSQHAELLLFYADGVPQSVDVKTASRADHRRFLCAVAQGPDRDTLYVGARLAGMGNRRGLDRLAVELWGWLWGREVMELRIEGFPYDAHCCFLDELGDLATCWGRFSRGPVELCGRAVELLPA